MDSKIVILGAPGSGFAARLASRLDAENGPASVALALDAPWAGGAVSLRPGGSVVWQGVELRSASTVLVERPIFPWPQPQRLEAVLLEGVISPERAVAEREGRALALSALRWAAESVPVINSPESAHLAASPAVGLDRAAAAGIETCSWQLAPAPEEAQGRLVLDSVGREFWHGPAQPGPGEPAVLIEGSPEPVLDLFVVGTAVAAARRHSSGASWAAGAPAEPLVPSPPTAEFALRAARAAGLTMAGIVIDGAEPHRLLWLDAAPDLDRWDDDSDGRVTAALADLLRATPPTTGGRPE